MTRIDRYLLSRFSWTFVRALFAVVFLFIFIDLLTHRREEILEHDVPTDVVMLYYACLTPEMLRDFQIAAIAMLVSTFLVFGRAAQTQEITAMRASGVGVHRFMRWPAAFSLAVVVTVFALSETIGIAAAARANEIESRYFSKLEVDERPGKSWVNLNDGWKFHVRKFNPVALTGEGALLLKISAAEVHQIRADRVFWDPDRGAWILEDGTWSVFFPEEGMSVETRHVSQEAAPVTESAESLLSVLDDPASRTIPELRHEIDVARARNMPVQAAEVNYHLRYAAPPLSFIMMWIALPFALRLRRGGVAVSLAASVGIGLAYLVVYAGATGLGQIGRLDPFIAAWVANFVFAGVGTVLMLRSPK